jgi:hypothetical protein
VLPDDTIAKLIDPAARPRLAGPIELALIGALLEDPRRADTALAALGDRVGLAFFATTAPCRAPPPLPNPPPSIAAIAARASARLEVAAAQCQALVQRLRPAP